MSQVDTAVDLSDVLMGKPIAGHVQRIEGQKRHFICLLDERNALTLQGILEQYEGAHSTLSITTVDEDGAPTEIRVDIGEREEQQQPYEAAEASIREAKQRAREEVEQSYQSKLHEAERSLRRAKERAKDAETRCERLQRRVHELQDELDETQNKKHRRVKQLHASHENELQELKKENQRLKEEQLKVQNQQGWWQQIAETIAKEGLPQLTQLLNQKRQQAPQLAQPQQQAAVAPQNGHAQTQQPAQQPTQQQPAQSPTQQEDPSMQQAAANQQQVSKADQAKEVAARDLLESAFEVMAGQKSQEELASEANEVEEIAALAAEDLGAQGADLSFTPGDWVSMTVGLVRTCLARNVPAEKALLAVKPIALQFANPNGQYGKMLKRMPAHVATEGLIATAGINASQAEKQYVTQVLELLKQDL
ncbi:hypothetical protein [Salisaeta icosahedral phage 1]|uniref:hypothetical protein n=1 Tax=Salisaeta icosahedral phage 1 TaxID=1183239 RepID=UPI00025EA92E|nr:hypothetical protein A322_gp33 [Salisaeta icosahedral phage 1]AFJ21488.1 hypothetical protein [Salisaeta icosahedral phage 1]